MTRKDELRRRAAQSPLVARLLEALQLLYDCQNGCPLPKYQADWDKAMQLAQQVLKEPSNTKENTRLRSVGNVREW